MPARSLIALTLLLSLLWICVVIAGAIGSGALIPADIRALFAPAPVPEGATPTGEDIARVSHRVYQIATLQTLALVALIALGPPLATALALRYQLRKTRKPW